MRVLAIGATGVLGRELVPLLLTRGHRVTVMAPGGRLEALPPGAARERASLLDPGIVDRLRDRLAGVDVVVNVATAVPRDLAARRAWEENTRLRRAGTEAVVRAVTSAGTPALVQMSITMAYPDGGDRWLDESEALDTSPARAHLAEPVAAMEAAVTSLPPDRVAWTILRGARFVGRGTSQDDLRCQLRSGDLRLPGDGREYVSMVHVADFASAVLAVVESPKPGTIFNIADEPVRAKHYFAGVAAFDGRPPPPVVETMPPDTVSHRVSSTAARVELGWWPAHGIWPLLDPDPEKT